MSKKRENPTERTGSRSPLAERLVEAEAASGIGAFVLDLTTREWAWNPPVAMLFGFSGEKAPAAFEDWLKVVFADDATKIRHALDVARDSGNFYVEFRVKTAEGPLHWLAGKGQAGSGKDGGLVLRGTFYDIGL
jgi:PAS domain-containing protein